MLQFVLEAKARMNVVVVVVLLVTVHTQDYLFFSVLGGDS